MKNKITYWALIFLVLMGSIGSCSQLSKKTYIDPVLLPAFENWKVECIVRGIRYKGEINKIDSILYAPLEEGYWGRCYGDKIIINSESVPYNDEFLLKLILFHELGHCAFDYDHNELGVDIMNSILPQNEIFLYQYFWDVLSGEYFDRYLTKRERRRLMTKLEKLDCFCTLHEDKLQYNGEQQTTY